MIQPDHLRLWPPAASDDYVRARLDLLKAERELAEQAEAVAGLRRALPAGAAVADAALTTVDPVTGEPVPITLGSLFAGHPSLVVYHLMYQPDAEQACPMCSMWVDGLDGVAHHLAQRTGLAVVAKAPAEKLAAWGRFRGWRRVRLVSSYGTGFNAELGVEDPGGEQHPAFSVFTRSDAALRHVYTMQAAFSPTERERGIDLLSPVWQVLDLLPEGRGSWYAGNDYIRAGSGDES